MTELYIGLMSGTSLDGIDAALVDFSSGQCRLLDFYYLPYTQTLKSRIKAISLANQPVLLSEVGECDSLLGELFAQAVLALLTKNQLSKSDIFAIGSHGQTIYHAPQGRYGFSLQIADPNRIAALTGITTIADFRRRDIALGGQGAPLVPAFHQALFADSNNAIAIVNIGGIANITLLNKNLVYGFDTGPGNTLLDYWCQKHTGQAYDANGVWASTGMVQNQLLAAFLADPFFQLPAPKSTGTEYFSADWLAEKLSPYPDIKAEDVQATLIALTASSIAEAILADDSDPTLTLVCGGGAHNKTLMYYLENVLKHPVQSTSLFGVEPDHVEAMAFAWLARQTLNNKTGNLTSVTGACSTSVLGGIYFA